MQKISYRSSAVKNIVNIQITVIAPESLGNYRGAANGI